MVSSSTFLLYLVLLFTTSFAFNDGTGYKRDLDGLTGGNLYNSTTDADKIICGYQLSGNYCILNRVLYYALIIFSVIGYSHAWLIAGALASVLTYSGTAAVHAVILTEASRSGAFDIDILGAWAIVSVACLTVMPIFAFSPKIRESVVSPIFGLWGTLVAIGATCSIVSLDREFPDEALCQSNGERPQLLLSPAQLAESSFNCTYACFSTKQILRSSSELIALPAPLPFAHFPVWQAAAGITGGLGIVMAAFGICFPAMRKSTEAELRKAIQSNRARHGDLPKARRAKANRRREAYAELKSGQYNGPGKCVTCWSGLSCIGAIVVVILNEIFLLHYEGGFPYNEQPFAVGQWGPWVSVLLALLAAGLVRVREPNWRERQALIAKEKKEFDERKALQQQVKMIAADGTVILPMNTGQDAEENGNKLMGFGEAFREEMARAAATGDAVALKKCFEELTIAEAKGRIVDREIKATTESLVRAAGNGHFEVVRLFLDYDVSVDAVDYYGMTALTRAAWAGHEDIVHLLVTKGAQTTGAEGQVALTRAKVNGHTRIAAFLEAHGAPSETAFGAARARTQ